MVQLQNSPTPRQARPARPKWPPPCRPRVRRSRGPGGAPGPVPPGPQGSQRQLPASSLELAAPSGGAERTDGRAALGSGRRAAGGSVAPSARPGQLGVGSRVCTDNGRTSFAGGAGPRQELLTGGR